MIEQKEGQSRDEALQAQLNYLQTNCEGVEITGGQQPWCDLFLADGHRLRVQVNVKGLYRDRQQTTPDGLPAYHITADLNVMAFRK